MISDLGTAMQRDGVFAEEQTLKDKLLIKQSDNSIIVPNVMMGTPVKEVDHEFFLISVSQFLLDQLRPAQVEQVLDSKALRLPSDEQKERSYERRPQEVHGQERAQEPGREVQLFPTDPLPLPRTGHRRKKGLSRLHLR